MDENKNVPTHLEPPIEWPVVKVDGVDITVKYSLALNYKCSKLGIDLRGLADGTRQFAAGLDLFAVIAAPQLEALGRPVLSGEEWAERLANLDQYTAISTAIRKAYDLSKVAPVETAPAPKKTADTGPRPN